MLPEFAAQDRDLMNKSFLGYLKGGLEGYAYSLSDRKYIMDKSFNWSGDFYLLKTIFNGENPKIIIMVRDLREIIASMESQFRFSPYRAYPDVDYENLKLTTLEKTWKSKMSYLNNQVKEKIKTSLDRATACGKIKDCEKEYLHKVLDILGRERYKKWMECHKYNYKKK